MGLRSHYSHPRFLPGPRHHRESVSLNPSHLVVTRGGCHFVSPSGQSGLPFKKHAEHPDSMLLLQKTWRGHLNLLGFASPYFLGCIRLLPLIHWMDLRVTQSEEFRVLLKVWTQRPSLHGFSAHDFLPPSRCGTCQRVGLDAIASSFPIRSVAFGHESFQDSSTGCSSGRFIWPFYTFGMLFRGRQSYSCQTT